MPFREAFVRNAREHLPEHATLGEIENSQLGGGVRAFDVTHNGINEVIDGLHKTAATLVPHKDAGPVHAAYRPELKSPEHPGEFTAGYRKNLLIAAARRLERGANTKLTPQETDFGSFAITHPSGEAVLDADGNLELKLVFERGARIYPKALAQLKKRWDAELNRWGVEVNGVPDSVPDKPEKQPTEIRFKLLLSPEVWGEQLKNRFAAQPKTKA